MVSCQIKLITGVKKMNRIKNLLGVMAFSLLVLALPTIASAQWGGNNRGNNRNGGYYNAEQLKSTIKRLKSDSKDFAKFVDRERKNRYNNNRGDNLDRLSEEFKKAADRLESRFDSKNMYKTQSEAQNVINLANQIDRVMNRSRSSYDLQNYWNNIERQVNEIARAYRFNNGRGNNGGWRNNFPF